MSNQFITDKALNLDSANHLLRLIRSGVIAVTKAGKVRPGPNCNFITLPALEKETKKS